MSILFRRFTILALASGLFAFGMANAVARNHRVADRYTPLTACSAVSGLKCVSSL